MFQKYFTLKKFAKIIILFDTKKWTTQRLNNNANMRRKNDDSI